MGNKRKKVWKGYPVLFLCILLVLSGCQKTSAKEELETKQQEPENTNETLKNEKQKPGNLENGDQEPGNLDGILDNGNQEPENPEASSENKTSSGITELGTIQWKEEDLADTWAEDACIIDLSGTTAKISGSGAAMENGDLKITAAGTYVLSGELSRGQIYVKAGEEAKVHLVFNGVSVSCPDSSAVYIKKTGSVTLTLAAGTINTLTDGETYIYDDVENQEPSAALFSKCDLVINGSGTLNIQAQWNDAVTCKDSLLITNGTFHIISADDGIIGRDELKILGGTFFIQSKGDGLKSTNASDTSLGNILIEGGEFTITSGADGIQAEHAMKLSGGKFEITTGGGSASASKSNIDTSSSFKGIKAGTSLEITGGNFWLNCLDDALHTNGTIQLSNGEFEIQTGDDGIHADSDLLILGGKINIISSYEGLEAQNLQIDDGTIYVTASDDGVNAAGGNDSSGQGGWFKQDKFSGGNSQIVINGGYLVVTAAGDGLDANGSIIMNGGTVLVNGPADNGNGALDYDSAFTINGGVLIAAGSSGMTQSVSGGTQGCIAMTFSSMKEANTTVSLTDETGAPLISFAPSKRFQTIIISSPDLTAGASYTVCAGGTAATVQDGYGSGEIEGAKQIVSFTLSDTILWLNESGITNGNQGMGGGMGRPGGGRGGR